MMIDPNDVLDDEKLTKAYKSVFGGPDGLLVLQHLCQAGYVLSSTFVRGDTHETAANEGARRLVLSIIRKANFTPTGFPNPTIQRPVTTTQPEPKQGDNINDPSDFI